MNEVKVETELRLLCLSQIIHSAASYAEIHHLLEKEEAVSQVRVSLMRLSLTLPLTSRSAELSFSKLRIIKSRLRSTMTQEKVV